MKTSFWFVFLFNVFFYPIKIPTMVIHILFYMETVSITEWPISIMMFSMIVLSRLRKIAYAVLLLTRWVLFPFPLEAFKANPKIQRFQFHTTDTIYDYGYMILTDWNFGPSSAMSIFFSLFFLMYLLLRDQTIIVNFLQNGFAK